MKKKLLNNYGLKLLSILCAIILWIAIVNTNDPYDKVTITRVPVILLNTEVLTDSGYLYEIIDGTDYVTLTVKGPRSIVENLKNTDFKAEAKIISEFSETAKIDVECIKSNIDYDNLTITMAKDEVKLDIQNRTSKTFDVIAVIDGTPANGYYTDETLVSISPSTIKISGPENIIEQIDSVKVNIGVTGENANITTNITPTLYNAAGGRINSSKLTFSKEQITCKLDVIKQKTVDVNYAVTGNVEEGYRYTSINTTLPKVVIAGTDSELAKINSIDIPANLIDLTGLTGDKTYSIRVSQYVPNTVKYITSDTYASVTVTVEQLKSKSVNLLNSNITVKNLATGYKLEFADNSINLVSVKGIEADLEKFTSDDLNAEIDLTGLKEGTHSVQIKITSKKDVEIVGNYKVNVKVTQDMTKPEVSTVPDEDE